MPQISIYAECAALICSTFLFFFKTEKYLRSFAAYMFVVVITEYSSYLCRKYLNHSNLIVYNFFVPCETLFFLWVFSKSFIEQRTKKIIYTLSGVYILFVFVDAIYIQTEIFKLHVYDLILGNIFISSVAIFYLNDSDDTKGKRPFLADTLFWVAIGLLLYSLPMSIMYSSFEYMAYKKIESKLFNSAFSVMNNVCNIIEYLFFSFGFVCRLKLKT